MDLWYICSILLLLGCWSFNLFCKISLTVIISGCCTPMALSFVINTVSVPFPQNTNLMFTSGLQIHCWSGMNLRRQAQIGDWCCFPVFSTLGQFLQCVLGLFEQAISNVVPSLLYTEDFQQPIGSSNVASISE